MNSPNYLGRTSFSKWWLFFFTDIFCIFLLYCFITSIVLWWRIFDQNIWLEYSMPGVDTDGAVWLLWFKSHFGTADIITPFLTFPFGFDLKPIPFESLTDKTRSLAVWALGGSYKSIVFVINSSALLAYPIAGLSMYHLCYKITKDRFGSFTGGIIFCFSSFFLLMSRGSLANNHFWLIPIVCLYTLKAAHHDAWPNFIIAAFLASIQFALNAYWGFYCLIAALFFLASNGSYAHITINGIKFLLSSCAFLFIFNYNFLVQQFFSLFLDPYRNVIRPVLPEISAYLFPISDVLLPSSSQIIYPFGISSSEGGSFLGWVPLVTVVAFFIFNKNRNQRLTILMMIGLLFSIALSSRIPNIFLINSIYFSFFGFFRSVSRFIQIASLFLGILFAISFCDFLTKKIFTLKARITASVITSFILILEIFPNHPTIHMKTDMSQPEKIYSDIRNSTDISAIASYPMAYSNQFWGTAPNHELIAQVFLEKPVAGWKDLRMLALNYSKDPIMGEVEDAKTISTLKKLGINTIFIYNRFLKESHSINRALASDSRLRFIGRYQIPLSSCRSAANSIACLSLDISVYHII